MKGASQFLTAVAILALAFTTGVANAADCTAAAPNPCYNAPGNASICCPGSCGPSTGEGGVTATCAGTPPAATPASTSPSTTPPAATPTPGTVTIYIVFDFSSSEMNCAGQASAPGGGTSFGDICLYKGPILASDLKTKIGTYVEIDTTFRAGPDDNLNAATTFYLTTGDLSTPGVDALSSNGVVSLGSTELAIVGGTGKYRGARGYIVSGQGVDISPKADGSILAFPKEFHLF